MSKTSGVCGAVAGGVIAIGLALGRDVAGQSAEQAAEVTRTFVGEFERQFGSRNCTELLGCDLSTAEGRATFDKEHLRDRCAGFTRNAAEMVARDVLQPA